MRMRIILLVAVATVSAAARDWHFDEGHWQLELSGYGGVYSGKVERSDDAYLTGVVGYEFPAFTRMSLSLRLRPLFVYFQDENKHRDSDTIWGVGAGLAARIYQHQVEMNGWFAELSAGVLWHSRYFEGNNSRVNFMPEVGVGYQFRKSDWSIVLRAQHLSNGGMGSKNAGVNGIGLGIGFRF
jgi:hypothetical protein